jgi:hypothetical protein
MKIMNTLGVLLLMSPLTALAQMDEPGKIMCPGGEWLDLQEDVGSRGGDAPVNDECTGAVPQDLMTGGSITLSGNNTGANPIQGTDFIAVWEAVVLEDCATLTVNYCLAGSVFQAFINVITNSCPDVTTGMVTASFTDQCSMVWEDVPPGTWYIPVLADPTFAPMGDYSIMVTAQECDPYYCLAQGGSQMTTGSIIGISFADVLYFDEPTGTGYTHHLTQTAQVGTGNVYEIIITLDDGGEPMEISEDIQLLAWIDFDHNGILNDPGELVFFTDEATVGNVYTGTVTIPETALLGETRMRIRLHDAHDGTDYTNEPNSTPCGPSTYGQVHDLQVSIDLGTGIDVRERQELTLYPNPGNGNIQLTGLELSGTGQVFVYDATGRLVRDFSIPAQNGDGLFLSFANELSKGFYRLGISDGNKVWNAGFVIE